MADHNWVQDHIASYLAGGLDAAERGELEAHLAGCGDCSLALDQARQLDCELSELFAAVRPSPGLEDRAIRHLRLQWNGGSASPLRRRLIRMMVAAAAVLLLGFIGAGMSYLIDRDGLAVAADEEGGMPEPTFSEELLDAVGYHQPSRALVVRGSSRTHSRLDGGITNRPGIGIMPGSNDGVSFEVHRKSTNQYENDSGDLTAADLAAKFRERNLSVATAVTPTMPPITQDGLPAIAEDPPSGAVNYTLGEGKQPASFGDLRATVKTRDEAYQRSQARTGSRDSVEESRGAPVGDGAIRGPLPTGGVAGITFATGQAEGGEAHAKKLTESDLYYNYRDHQTHALKGKETKGLVFRVEAKTEPKSSGGTSAGDPLPAALTPPVTQTPPPPVAENGEVNQPPGPDKPKVEPEPKLAPEAVERKIIRSGEMEFEVENFDSAVDRIEKITAEEGGALATVNSDKLPNGKMKGSVVLRVPPKKLDDLIKKLRALGELKRQRLGSQDVTKMYYDIESRLKAARVMEKRLLEIIAKGNGQVKDLIEAEKELGVWRTRIEELEGEIRYYANLVSLATLTIQLTEKDIRTAYAVIEQRRVDLGIEVEDVEAAQRKAHELVAQAKGRITRSELRKGEAGTFQAILHFEATPEESGPLLDGLKQIGTVTRQEMDQSQQTEGGVKRPFDAKITKVDVQFQVSLFNLATVAPEESVHVSLAVADVEEAYKQVLARAEKTAVRVLASNLDQSRPDQATASLVFEVKTADADGILALIKQAGEVMRLQEVETQGATHVTKAKRGFKIDFHALASVKPRVIITQSMITAHVPKSYQALQEAVTAAKGRILDARLDEPDNQNVTAQLHFDVGRAEDGKIQVLLNSIGAVFGRTVSRDTQNEGTLESKVGYRITLFNQAAIKPRETIILGIEVPEVEKLVAHLTSQVVNANGRTISSSVTRERSGLVTAKLVYHVPYAALPRLAEEFKQEGHVLVQDAVRNPQVPENDLAIGRLEVTLSYRPIVETGFWESIRRGVEKSLAVLGTSVTWVVFGLLTVLPVAVVVYVLYRLAGRGKKEPAAPAA